MSACPKSQHFKDCVSQFEHSVHSDTSFRPTLFVFGDYEHFAGSVLGLASKHYWNVKHAQDTASQLRFDTNCAFLKWSPWSRYNIPSEITNLLPQHIKIINNTGFHCSKKNVHRAFKSAFGYSFLVDSVSAAQPAVLKSCVNAAHDGKVVTVMPNITELTGHVLERVIDNTFGELVCDVRLPWILGKTPFVYLKLRPLSNRFSNTNSWATIVSPTDVLTNTELRNVGVFCETIGLQYGELDILRDNYDHRIYVVDANNTPYGPPNGLSEDLKDLALRLLRGCCTSEFFTACRNG
jgi:hypothetical protein